jgi:hypothetical protein
VPRASGGGQRVPLVGRRQGAPALPAHQQRTAYLGLQPFDVLAHGALGAALDEAHGIVEQAARDVGRNPADIGLEGRVNYTGDLDTALASIENWRAVGATHLSINTMGAGLSGVDKHLAVLRDMASSLTPGL